MQITRVEKLDKGRMRIFLEDKIMIILYKNDARDIELSEGSEISPEKYQYIQKEILIPRAKKRAFYLLEKMDRTEYQLAEKLRLGYDEEIVNEVLLYVKDLHYIDDFRYACNYVRYRCSQRSRRRLFMDLRQKGVDKESIERAIEEEYGEKNEIAIIEKWISKKHYDPKEADEKGKQKMYQFLMRKGFCSEDILKKL